MKPAIKLSINRYILIAIDYATKWGEAPTICINIIVVITKLLYEHIFIWFGCPLTIAIDQGTNFINDAIKYLTNHFILKHPIILLFTIHKETMKLNLITSFLEAN